MSNQSYDVIVAKEYETRKLGQVVKKTAWNRVGRAWKSRDSEAINFELYLFPNQRYVIPIREPQPQVTPEIQSEDTPF